MKRRSIVISGIVMLLSAVAGATAHTNNYYTFWASRQNPWNHPANTQTALYYISALPAANSDGCANFFVDGDFQGTAGVIYTFGMAYSNNGTQTGQTYSVVAVGSGSQHVGFNAYVCSFSTVSTNQITLVTWSNTASDLGAIVAETHWDVTAIFDP